MSRPRLSVNIDHVATVRQARLAGYPDPVEAAHLAEEAGAAGITVHLRQDRRHVQDADVAALARVVRGKLNLEMAAVEEMETLALGLRPHQVTLVPERPEEVTTEGGLDLARQAERIGAAARRLHDEGIAVSLFLDPDPAQIERAAGLGGAVIEGVELNTDAYTRARPDASDAQLVALHRAAEAVHAAGLRVYAGHGLTTTNVGPVADLPHVEELNIGHFLVARAVMVGMTRAVREMLAAMGDA